MSEIERAIEYFERKIVKNDRACENCVAPFAEEAKRQWVEIDRPIGELALKILRAELDREKNEPLTLEEIKELYEAAFSGFPVWCKYLNEYSYPFGAVIDRYDGQIVAVHAAGLKDDELNREEDYGQTWLAYRYEPKGEPNV